MPVRVIVTAFLRVCRGAVVMQTHLRLLYPSSAYSNRHSLRLTKAVRNIVKAPFVGRLVERTPVRSPRLPPPESETPSLLGQSGSDTPRGTRAGLHPPKNQSSSPFCTLA